MTNTPLNIEPLVERSRAVLKALGAIGASAVGATALMVVAGASYYQSLLEGIHATGQPRASAIRPWRSLAPTTCSFWS